MRQEQRSTRALIDGDIVRYRTGFASNDVPEHIACARANETLEQILEAVQAGYYSIYLSDSEDNNFRNKLYPGYKQSRKKQPKPKHHEALGYFLKQEWGAVVTTGQEADDALGIEQTECLPIGPSVICSIDKDLLQVPGRHYNWVKNEFIDQTYLEGLRCFYEQCLSGDRTDDVPGIQGIGKAKAKKALARASSEQEMIEIVRAMWMDDEALLLTGQLLWVRRYPGELWTFMKQDSEPKSLSSSTKPKGIGPCSAHGIPELSGAPDAGCQTDVIVTTLTPTSTS